MKVTENTTELKKGTILKDNEGDFFIEDYDGINDWYICIPCNRYGTIIFKDTMWILKIKDMIGAKIITTP